MTNTFLEKLNSSPNRRMTIKNRDLNLEKNLSVAWENMIKEVDDKSDSDSSGLERSSVTRSISIGKRDREKRSSTKVSCKNLLIIMISDRANMIQHLQENGSILFHN